LKKHGKKIENTWEPCHSEVWCISHSLVKE